MAGSIEKRGIDKWRLVVSAGLDKEGKQVKKTKTITTNHKCELKSCKDCAKEKHCPARMEASKQLALLVAEVEHGTYTQPTKTTLADFAQRWIRDYGEVHLVPKTLSEYKYLLKRILEALGHLRIEKITPTHLLAFYANLQEKGIREDGQSGGLSEKTILHYHRLLSSIFNDAVMWQVIPSNPASRVKPPKVPKKIAKHFDEQQTMEVLTALENEPPKYKLAITLTIFTGVRKGELMAMEWQDINFTEGTIRVERATQYVTGVGVVTGEPKTEKSKRVISIPVSVMALLKQYKAYQAQERLKVGDLWQNNNRLLTAWDGQPMHPGTISKWWKKFLKRHELPHIPFHGLRHTSATLLIGQGLHAKTISDRLGHSTIAITMDTYGHFLKSADQVAAEKLENLLTKKSN
jgi:integrase